MQNPLNYKIHKSYLSIVMEKLKSDIVSINYKRRMKKIQMEERKGEENWLGDN